MKRTRIIIVFVFLIPVVLLSGYVSGQLELVTWRGPLFGVCVGALYGIFTRHYIDARPPRVIYLHWLAKVRAWIDRRLPRDVLRVTVIDTGKGTTLFSATHMEVILALKMGERGMTYPWDGKILIQFTTEHLTV